MKQLFLNNSISLISKYNKELSEMDIEKILYGLEGLYLTFFKLIAIMVLAMLFGIVREVVALLLAYNILRFFAFGFHAESSNDCLILSICLFIVLPLGVFKQIVSVSFAPIACAFCLVGYWFFAPSDTVKRPLINPKKRLIRKVTSTLLVFIYMLICIFSDSEMLIKVVFLAVIIEFFMINPITYKLYNQPYSNYKTYQG